MQSKLRQFDILIVSTIFALVVVNSTVAFAGGDTASISNCRSMTDTEDSLFGLFYNTASNKIEECWLEALPHIVSKEGVLLHIKLNDGSIKTFESADSNSDMCQLDPCSPFYHFVNYLPTHQYIVLSIMYDEGYAYEMVSLETGESHFFASFPQLSPNGQKFFAFSRNSSSTALISGIWELNDKMVKVEFESSLLNNNRALIKWLSDIRLRVQAYSIVYDSELGKNVTVEGQAKLLALRNGNWQIEHQVGETHETE